MRIDGPKGLGAWLQGWFSGSFKGNLEGTSSYAETASYVDYRDVDGLEDNYLNKKTGGLVEGPIELSGSTEYKSRLIVHGNIRVIGSVVEGIDTKADEEAAHAEGKESQALGVASHAEGKNTRALGLGSHAEGRRTKAIGIGSHAEGFGTIAAGDYQHVIGQFNRPDASNEYTFIVGNGSSDELRSNAFAVKSDGNVEFGNENSVSISGSAVKANELIVRERVDDKSIDRIALEYGQDGSLEFRFLSEVKNTIKKSLKIKN